MAKKTKAKKAKKVPNPFAKRPVLRGVRVGLRITKEEKAKLDRKAKRDKTTLTGVISGLIATLD